MAEREKTYWWHLGRLKIIESYINKLAKESNLRILNVGCGTGGTIKMLQKYGQVDNVDISDDAIKFMKKEGFNNIYKVDGIKLPFKDKQYDLVVAFDVLEHIDEHG